MAVLERVRGPEGLDCWCKRAVGLERVKVGLGYEIH